jgi:maltokinase
MIPEQALAQWLPRQRWFAGKGAEITGLAIAEDTELAAGDGVQPALRHLILAVTQGMVRDNYQVLVGLRDEIPGRLEHAVIGPADDGRVGYDALHDHELTRLLLRDFANERGHGRLRFARAPGAPFAELLGGQDTDSLVLTGEQSNTSLVFGEAAILKVFRRVAPGPNPDLEVSAALGRLGSPHIAEPYGWIEAKAGGEVTILAIMSRYLRAASDGWSLAATSVRDLYAQPATGAADAGGDFAGEAHRLGAATAAVHKDLVRAFGAEESPPYAVAQLADQMNIRLADALAAVPALREHAGMLGEAYSQLAKLHEPMPVQRIHGDYHLGQVMRTQTGWVVLDFEGEPAVPLAIRRARSSPLRDVAGMLRSFDYAARHQLLGHADRVVLELSARDWVRRNTAAFCAGYAEADGADPRQHATLLRALECDKAVYEVVYEARNRPSWLPIPLDSLAAMSLDSPDDRPLDGPDDRPPDG